MGKKDPKPEPKAEPKKEERKDSGTEREKTERWDHQHRPGG